MQKGFEVVNLHGTASGVIAVPVIGENGNWWIGNEDTGIKAQGEPGEPGPQGEKGEAGVPGVDPAELERLREEVEVLKSNLNVRYSPDNDKIQVYYEDKWVNVFGKTGAQTYYLYNSGNEYTIRTGGWKSVKGGGATNVKKDNALGVYIPVGGSEESTFTVSKVDLTGFNWLIFSILDVSLSKLWNNQVGISSQNTTSSPVLHKKQYDVAANNIVNGNLLKLDISSYQGEYYIQLYQTLGGGVTTGGCYYDRIWLE